MKRDLDPEGAGAVGVGGTRHSTRDTLHADGRAAAGDAHALDHVGYGADARELAVEAGNQQDPLLVTGLHGDRRRHAGKEDRIV